MICPNTHCHFVGRLNENEKCPQCSNPSKIISKKAYQKILKVKKFAKSQKTPVKEFRSTNAQERLKDRRFESKIDRRNRIKNKFLSGAAKMRIQTQADPNNPLSRAAYTYLFGFTGYALSQGADFKNLKVKVWLNKNIIKISGELNTELSLNSITKTTYQSSKPYNIKIFFKDGSHTVLGPDGKNRKDYPEILNELIQEKIKNIRYDIESDKPVSTKNKEISIMDEIKKAKELYDADAITKEEYQKIKDKYLNKI